MVTLFKLEESRAPARQARPRNFVNVDEIIGARSRAAGASGCSGAGGRSAPHRRLAQNCAKRLPSTFRRRPAAKKVGKEFGHLFHHVLARDCQAHPEAKLRRSRAARRGTREGSSSARAVPRSWCPEPWGWRTGVAPCTSSTSGGRTSGSCRRRKCRSSGRRRCARPATTASIIGIWVQGGVRGSDCKTDAAIIVRTT